MRTILFGVVFVASTISYGNCLKCYSCDSTKAEQCNSGFASMATQDCDLGGWGIFIGIPPSTKYQCVKVTARDNHGKEVLDRSCFPQLGLSCEDTIRRFDPKGSKDLEDFRCYLCNGDKCNSSITIQSSITATIIFNLLFFLFNL